MSNTLKKSTKSFYDEKTLSEQQQDALGNLLAKHKVEMTEEGGNANKGVPRSGFWSRRIVTGVASSVTLALMAVLFLLPNSANIQGVATEVAENHRHLKPLTIQSSSYEKTGAFFSELGFLIKESSLLDEQRWQLMGGRYCSVNGVKAAQLRLRDKRDNSVQTFYQVNNKPGYFEGIPDIRNNELPVTLNIDGLPVQVWSEGGIVYSLTHSLLNTN